MKSKVSNTTLSNPCSNQARGMAGMAAALEWDESQNPPKKIPESPKNVVFVGPYRDGWDVSHH